MFDSPWAVAEESRPGKGLNWPLIGVLALDGLAWLGIVSVAVPLLSKIPF